MAKHFKPRPKTAALITPENTKYFCYDSKTGHYEEVSNPDNGFIEVHPHNKLIEIDVPTMYFDGVTHVYIGNKNEFVQMVYEDR